MRTINEKKSIINQLLIVIKCLPVIWMIYKRVMSKGEYWYVEKVLELLEALTNCDTTK